MNITQLHYRVARDAPAPNCPGGIGRFSFSFFKVCTLIVFSLGNFGFNSYDLLTFGLMVMGAGNKIHIVRFIFYDQP